jgi:hypothetical protein
MSHQRDSRLRAGPMDGSIRLIGRTLRGRSTRMSTDAAPIGPTLRVALIGLFAGLAFWFRSMLYTDQT